MSNLPLVFLDPYPRTPAMVYTNDFAADLAAVAEVVSHFGSRAPDALVAANLPRVTVIIGQPELPAERLRAATNLRAVINVKGNWEPSLNYQAAAAQGIYVLSVAPAMAPAVAEFCLAQAITLGRGLHVADELFRAGTESYGSAGNSKAVTLHGANVGLVGFGNLGQALAPLLKPFTDKIYAYDPWLSAGYLRTCGVTPTSLDDVLSNSDYLFLLAAPTADNEDFLDKAGLAKIKANACVILASRAEIVFFKAFLRLAGEGRFRAAVDVYPAKPVSQDATWRATPNVLFTAHLAGGLASSYQLIREMVLDDVKQVLQGLPPTRLQRAEPQLAGLFRAR